MPLTTHQKLKHTKNRYKELCDKREALTELLLKITLNITKSVIVLDKQISAAEKEIEKLQK